MCRGLGGSFAHVLFPRLFLIAFTFAQPFLITSVLELLEKPEDEGSRIKGYFLVIATLLIYLGIAVRQMTALAIIFLIGSVIFTAQQPCFKSLHYDIPRRNCVPHIQQDACPQRWNIG
jgi:small basic protein